MGLFLVVDDEQLVAKSLRKMIAPFGDVVVAGDLAEGKRLIGDRSRSWTALFIDKMLPDGSGLELIGFARDRYPLLPILLVTGHNDREATNTALGLRVQVMEKPFEPELVRRFAAEATSRLTREEFDLRIVQVVDVLARTRRLSAAEADILLRKALCQTQNEIALARGASEETVRKQTASLRLKLGASAVEEAVLHVLREACGS
jgi:two-component system, LuxR family, response regulator FixJ